jgi:hypothetical protein
MKDLPENPDSKPTGQTRPGRCPRRRSHLFMALLCVIALGLASRAFPFFLPAALGKYPGDALWALMVLFGMAFLRPDLPPLPLALLALSVSWLVEFAQLYQAPWINSIRATRLGHLALGSRFHWPDILAYGIGVSVGLLLDVSLFFRRATRKKV